MQALDAMRDHRTIRKHDDSRDQAETGFSSWYARQYPVMTRTLAVASGDWDLARDATNEAMTRAYLRWDRLAQSDTKDSWAFAVAINYQKRFWRRRKMERERIAQSALRSPEFSALDLSDIDLWRAISDLPNRARQAVVLRYMADLTETEVARAMGVRPGTASASLNRARELLRIALDDRDSTDD